jgi:hypothetical protein
VTLMDTNNNFKLTITPALWSQQFFHANTILNVQLTNLTNPNLNITLTLQSLIVGTPLNDPNYVTCDPFSKELENVEGVNYCNSQGLLNFNGVLEVPQPTPITAADMGTTRWDFSGITAPPGSTSSTLSLVVNCIPGEFVSDYTDPNNGEDVACANGLSLPPNGGTEYLAIVSNGSSLISAGTLQLQTAQPAQNDTLNTATQIPATQTVFTDFIDTSATNPQEILTGGNAGGMINGQGDPFPPCSNPNSQSVFRSVWYTFTPTQNNFVRISTDGSRYDTVVYVYTTAQPPQSYCNDDGPQQPDTLLSSDLSFAAVTGQQYYIMVSEYQPDVGSLNGVPTAIPLSNDATLRFSLIQANPVPLVDSIYPPSGLPGSLVPTLTVLGSGFADGAMVNINGTQVTPTAISPNKIVVNNLTLPSAPATVPITVVNPTVSPQSGTSNVTFFPLTQATASVGFNDTPNMYQDSLTSPLVADLNNDGKMDVVFVDSSSNVLIFLGNGDGTFPQPLLYPVVSIPSSIATGDFNGDGKPDLVVANSEDFTATVLLGDGDGTFQVQPPLNSGSFSISFVTVGDFNGDGWLDIAAVSYGTFAIFLGNGDGTFQPPQIIRSEQFLTYGIPGDFNGDGKLDIALLNSGNSTVEIFLGNGDGTFQLPIYTSTGNNPLYGAAGDFNGDGKLDLAVANSGDGSVSILLGNGDGTFQGNVYQTGGAFSMAAGDLNGDGKLDLVVENNNGFDLLFGDGTGKFPNIVTFNDPNTSNQAAVLGDFNNDGRLDVIATENNQFGIFLQQIPVASFSPTSLSFAAQSVSTLSPAKPLVLTNTGSAPLTVSSILGSGDFKQTNNCSGTLKVGAFCTINVIFNPTSVGTIVGSITVTDNASIPPQIVDLNGVGAVPLTLSPTGLAFGTIAVGKTSAAKTVTITNNAPKTQNITFVASGNYAAAGSGSLPCGSSLASGATCTISVTFTPTANGVINGAVTVTDHTVVPEQEVTLSGTGTGGAVAPLTFSPTSLSFLKQAFDTTSPPQPVTVTNGSTNSVTISTIVSSGNFNVTGVGGTPCAAGTVLAATKACTMNVTFTPTYLGTIKGAVVVSDNASVGQQVLNVSGVGILPVTFSHTTLTFSAQSVGTTSAPQSVTVTNNLTTTLSNIAMAASGDFLLANNTCSTTLAANSQCSFTVTFTPSQVGGITGGVTITDSAFTSPQAISLSGTGQ